MKIKKVIKFLFILLMIVLLFTSCSTTVYEIPADASWLDGFQYGPFEGILVFPISKILTMMAEFTGSVGFALILTTVVVRGITTPMNLETQRMTRKTQELQPKMTAIQAKYKGRNDQESKQKMSMEIQRLYSESGVNPLMTMVTPFLSLPFFMAVWRAVSYSEVVKGGTFLGFNLNDTPLNHIANGEMQYAVLLVLVVVTQFLSFRITTHFSKKRQEKMTPQQKANSTSDMMAKQMNIMSYVMTAMMGFMALSIQSGMSIYLVVSACITVAQAAYTNKQMDKEEMAGR